jgi:ribosomal protein S16
MEMSNNVWRFGYGSNIGLTTLREKKNLNPSKFLTGTIKGWELYFSPGIPHVEPGFAAVRANPDAVLHGSAFCIPEEEAKGLDKQEKAYVVLPCQFVSYDGNIIEDVGLYVPSSKGRKENKQIKEGTPSQRYLRLLQNGAREAPLSKEWIEYLDSFKYYTAPPEIRAQTEKWISEFHADPERKDNLWTMEKLAKYDGSDDAFPAHSSVMEYIVDVSDVGWMFKSWKGHNVTRRNLIHYNGKSVDAGDIRLGEEGFRPLPKLSDCSDEEREYLLQNLETLLHRGGKIVARLKDFLDDQDNALN